MTVLRLWIGALSVLAGPVLVVLAVFEFGDTAAFVKIVGLVIVFALWDIADEIRDVRKAVKR